MGLFNKKIKILQHENEMYKITIERLLETIFCNNELSEDEIDILLDNYPMEMNRVSTRQTLLNNIKENDEKPSAKIGFHT